jgi:hypothetical protein
MALLQSSGAGSRIRVRGDDYFQGNSPGRDRSVRAGTGASARRRGGREAMIKAVLIAGVLFVAAAVASGCAVQQPASDPVVAEAPAHPLPFKGRLAEGDASAVPAAVAMSLSDTSSVTFSYREELTHDDYHIPLIVTAFDPVTYVGAPLGDLGVTAFAQLSITDGDRVLGDYTAKVHISKSFTLYKEPTHKEVEEAARAAVREKIDQKLYRDEGRLAQAFASAGQPGSSTASPALGADQSGSGAGQTGAGQTGAGQTGMSAGIDPGQPAPPVGYPAAPAADQ